MLTLIEPRYVYFFVMKEVAGATEQILFRVG